MTALAIHPRGETLEFLKWVSERNTHIPISMLEYLIDVPPYIPDDEFDDEDFDEADSWD